MLERLHTLCFEAEEGAGLPEADPNESERDNDVDDSPGAAAAIDFTAPEAREAMREEFGSLLQGLMAQAPGEEEVPPDLDPYGDPQGFQGYMRQVIDNALEARMSQIQPTVQAFEDQQNQLKIDEWCASIPAIKEAQEMLGEAANDLPENIASQAVQHMATGYLRDLEERYGPGERAVTTALRMASDQLKTIVKAGHDAGYQARNNELRGISGAPAPTPPGARESVTLEDQPTDELAAAEAWINRRAQQ